MIPAISRSVLPLLLMVALCASPAFAEIRQVDVLITVVKDRVIALPGGGSPVEEPLGVNETVVTTAAQGPAGFALTNRRLLGFSSSLRRERTQRRLHSSVLGPVYCLTRAAHGSNPWAALFVCASV